MITLRIKENSKVARMFIAYAKSLSFVEEVEDKESKEDKALIKLMEKGRKTKIVSKNEVFEELRK